MPRKPIATNKAEPVVNAVDTEVKVVTLNTSALHAKVEKALKTRASSNASLHDVACEVLAHFATHRNNGVINFLFNGLKQNDRDAFRIWCVKHSQKENEKGETECFFKVTKKEGFTVVKGRKSDHVMPYEILLTQPSMFDIDQVKETQALTALKFLENWGKVYQRAKKQFDEMEDGERVKIPEAILGEIERVSRIAREASVKVH